MNLTKRIAMPALAALVLAACGGGGGGAGMMPALPEAPSAAVPVSVAEPGPKDEPVAEREPASEPERVAGPVAERAPVVEPGPVAPAGGEPDPATLLQSHDRLSLPEAFNAVQADEAMFLLANIPYREAPGGGAGLAAASLALQAEATDLYIAQRSAEYRADHASITFARYEEVDTVIPEVTTRMNGLLGINGEYQGCVPASGECVVFHPVENEELIGGQIVALRKSIGDMPFISDVWRDDAKGYRERGGVNLRYWSTHWGGNRGEPRGRVVAMSGGGDEFVHREHVVYRRVDNENLSYENLSYMLMGSETYTNTWSGYGAWNDWGGFGLVMLAHDVHRHPHDSAWYYFVAGGDLTGTVPEVSGTWHGAAIAMADDLSFIADGNATLTVTLGVNPTLDISMSDWQGYTLNGLENGVELGRPVGVPMGPLSATGIPIRPDGTFVVSDGSSASTVTWEDITAGPPGYPVPGPLFRPGDTGYISGAFYGPGGVEAAGTFASRPQLWPHQGGVHGAFGVRKPKE